MDIITKNDFLSIKNFYQYYCMQKFLAYAYKLELVGMFECLCHSEERSDEESLSYFNRPFVSLRVTDEMREILRYAQNNLSNWLFIPTNYNLKKQNGDAL